MSRKWSFRLPDGGKTDSVHEYTAAWQKMVDPICEATGVTLVGFDPGVLLDEVETPENRSSRRVRLPLWFAIKLSAALKQKEK